MRRSKPLSSPWHLAAFSSLLFASATGFYEGQEWSAQQRTHRACCRSLQPWIEWCLAVSNVKERERMRELVVRTWPLFAQSEPCCKTTIPLVDVGRMKSMIYVRLHYITHSFLTTKYVTQNCLFISCNKFLIVAAHLFGLTMTQLNRGLS